jgi:hypothetical protein
MKLAYPDRSGDQFQVPRALRSSTSQIGPILECFGFTTVAVVEKPNARHLELVSIEYDPIQVRLNGNGSDLRRLR